MPRSLWLLIVGMVINVTGASFLWPLNTIFIHDQLGKSLSISGLILMLNAGAGVIGNLIGGSLFDKIGGYRTILLGVSITLSAMIVMIFFHTFVFYSILMVILGFGAGMVFPSMYAMAGAVWPEGGRKAFNAVYVSQNLGVAIGAALGGLVASYRFDYVFSANAIMYIIFLFVAVFGYRNIDPKRHSASTNVLAKPVQIKNYTKLYALLTLCFAYLLCWVAYVQWQSTIATHTQSLGISLKQYSLLWTINGALIVLAQPFTSYIIKKWVKTLKVQITLGIVVFISSLFVTATAEVFTGFVVAMVILTIGEMFVWPAVPTIASELAPKGREGFYQGIVNSTATGGRMIGPLLGGLLVDYYHMEALFGVLIGLLLIAVFASLMYDRKLSTNEEEQLAVKVT